jgi:hypothetical protein
MYAYIAPYVSVNIGGWLTDKTSRVRVTSSCLNPVDVAEVVIPTEGVKSVDIARGAPVVICMGYREKGVWPVFSGKVEDVAAERELVVYARDMMEMLRQTRITKSFVDTVPQEVLKYSLTKAGVKDYTLDKHIFPRKHHFIVKDLTVIQAIKLVNSTWSAERPFYFEPQGRFYWGKWEESARYNNGTPAATLEYGENILSLEPSDNETGILTTFLLPFIKHSSVVLIRDSRFWDTEALVKIERVTYSHGEQGTEMELQWRMLKNLPRA